MFMNLGPCPLVIPCVEICHPILIHMDRPSAKQSHGEALDRFRRVTMLGLLVTFGIVFGDIGTSPLYVMKAIVRANAAFDADYIIGAVSCVIWTLTIQTTIKYVLIALRADNRGEGGILALYSLVRRRKNHWLYAVAAIGASALVADGVITPAVTVTSAIEGLRIFSPDIPVVGIVLVIIAGIFIIQSMGTGVIGKWFGPVMLLWFASLGVFGALSIGLCPSVFKAFNPWYAVRLLVDYPGWFLILGAVFLCTTGAEALYSDLGHCGRLNISVAWIFVKVMLIVNYLGQGAWILANPGRAAAVNPFYAVVPHGWLVPEIVLATLAAVIASQALISGSFTIFSEAVNLRFWPRMRIKYPSPLKGQLFIPSVNAFLFIGCVLTVLIFRSSDHMEAAYGLAITVTMLMTTVLLAVWLRERGAPRWVPVAFVVIFGAVEGAFLVANLFKFMHGGWYTILIAGVLLLIIFAWYNGSRLKDRFRQFADLDRYLGVISDLRDDRELPKYASNLVYISRAESDLRVDSKLVYSIINKMPKRADRYWIIRVVADDAPDTLDYGVNVYGDNLIYCVTMRFGYRVKPWLTVYLRQVVEDLQREGRVDITSRYPSLQSHGIPGEFRFVVINRIFSPSSNCRRRESFVMRLHDMIGRHSLSDIDAYGLNVCNVTVESAPMILNTSPWQRIKPVAEFA